MSLSEVGAWLGSRSEDSNDHAEPALYIFRLDPRAEVLLRTEAARSLYLPT
jgi:hypothetical protein